MNYRKLTLKKLMKKDSKVLKFLKKQGFLTDDTNIIDLPEGENGNVKRDIYTTLGDKEIMIVINNNDDITFLTRDYGSDDDLVLANIDMVVEDLVDYEVEQMKKSLALGDTEFLRAVLSGDGFTPYYSLPINDLHTELNEMRVMKRELNL